MLTQYRKPRSDDKPMWNLLAGMFGGPAVLVSHDLKLYSAIAEKPRTLLELCDVLHLQPRPLEALLIVNLSLGFIEKKDNQYFLTPVAEDYLLETSPTSYCGYLDLVKANYSVWSFENLKKAVMTNSPQVYGGRDVFKTHEEQAEAAKMFTRGMHGNSMAGALAWPNVVDLSNNHVLLDIGGGSGCHSIGVALRWPQLKCIVFDTARVCEVAQEFIDQSGMKERIKTQVGDMWSEDLYPDADVHFYSLIYHDWPVEKCQFLTQKSFKSLKPGGRIIIHEMLYNDDKTGPFMTAAFHITMLLWATGQQFSGPELKQMLQDAGFTNIEVKPSFGPWSIVTGVKP